MGMDKTILIFLIVACVIVFCAIVILALSGAQGDEAEYRRGRKYFEEPKDAATPIYLTHDEEGKREMETQPLEGYANGNTNVMIINYGRAEKKQKVEKKDGRAYAIPMPPQGKPKTEGKRNTGDEFLDSLTEKELAAFVQLFMEKKYDNVPEYVVGGKNETFFQRIFIHACIDRDRLPQNLLIKMCNRSAKYV